MKKAACDETINSVSGDEIVFDLKGATDWGWEQISISRSISILMFPKLLFLSNSGLCTLSKQ